MKKQIKLLSIIAGIVAGVVSSQAQSDKALIDTLVKKGFITTTEAESIKKDASSTAFAAKAKSTKKITFEGRLHFQYDNLSTETESRTAGVTSKVDGSQNGFYFRRVFLGAAADLGNGFGGSITTDFGGVDGTAAVDSAFISWKPGEYEVNMVKAGWDRVAFGVEEFTSSTNIKTVERSIGANYFTRDLGISGRKTGAFVNGGFGTMVPDLTYDLSVTNNDTDTTRTDTHTNGSLSSYAGLANTPRTGDDNSGAVMARLTYAGLKSADYGALKVAVGGGVILDGERNVLNSYNTADTATRWRNAGDVSAFEVSADYTFQDFNLLGTFMMADFQDEVATGQNKDRTPYAMTLIPSYKITPEWEVVGAYSRINANGLNNLSSTSLNRKSTRAGLTTSSASTTTTGTTTTGGTAAFIDTTPTATAPTTPTAATTTVVGAVTGTSTTFDNADQFYAGFNYYIMGNDLKLTAGYEYTKYTDSPNAGTRYETEVQGVRARLQLLF